MDKKIGVLHIIDKYGFGGVEKMVDVFIKFLNYEDLNVFYYFIRDLKTKQHLVQENIFIRNFSKLSLIPIFDLLKVIKDKNIQIIHTHHRKGFYIGCLLKILLPRIKFVHHEHGDILVKNNLYSIIFKLIRKKITKVICTSDYVKGTLIQKIYINSNKIEVLYNFIELAEPLKVVESLPDKKQSLTIGYMGRLSRVKGCRYLIESLMYLRSVALEFKVIIAGDGPQRAELEALAKKLGVFDSITFLGFVDGFESVCNRFDLIVMPSISEAGPLVLLEAWGCGVPAIVSDIKSITSIVKDRENVLLFKTEDAEDLAAKITELATSESLKNNLRANGFVEVKKYSRENYMIALKEIYKNL